ncbi:MAG: hypothetical protein EON58_12075 [Alphaproteobacteria bacterium]|nr:MAG: hypothetical protein EON58_12075 [Alphaproteobacteria bacterium]
MGKPCFYVNLSTWILTAARNEPSTWTQIVEWLISLSAGGIIVIDEIDKCGGHGEYIQSVRLELHDLLDGTIPRSAKIPDPTPDYMGTTFGAILKVDRETLAAVLKERVMVIGCGAWQSVWESKSNSLGFCCQPNPDLPTASQVTASLDPELRQRFRDRAYFLPPMVAEDYAQVAGKIADQIPASVRSSWTRLSGSAILRAEESNLGMRAFEELLLSSIVASKRLITGEKEKVREKQEGRLKGV